MSVIDEVKQRTDIIEVISQYTTLTKSGRTFRALCPFHSEKRPSFFVYPDQQSWHCFGACNTGGDVFSFIMKRENIDFSEALRRFAERAGVTIPSRYESGTGKEEQEKLYQINEAASQYFHNLLLNSTAGEKARSYLESRGFSVKSIADFQLGFSLNSWEAQKQYLMKKGYTVSDLLEAGLIVTTEDEKTHDRFRNRLMFPIHDARGRVTGFGARVLDDSLPKYINSPQTPLFDKSGTLYGLNLAAAAIRQQELAIIVEGYLDVITAHQNGFTNVIASMGTSVTEKQISSLIRQTNTKNILLALDADAAGEEAMLRCVDYENTLDAEVKVLVLPKGKDPDDVIKDNAETWNKLLADARTIMHYTSTIVTADLDMTKEENQILAASKLVKMIINTKDSIRLDRYLKIIEDKTGIEYKKLEEALSTIKQETKVRRPMQDSIQQTVRSIISNPLEEYSLTLLLQHPELKNRDDALLPEYFETSQNREIFVAWQQNNDLSSIRDKLDSIIWEHFDALVSKNIPDNQIETRYIDCALNLRIKYRRNREARRAEALALEEDGLAKLEEDGIENSIQLGKDFAKKARRGQEQRR